jgi:DHA1 family tetracycline resistance protein-like MFS transporter
VVVPFVRPSTGLFTFLVIGAATAIGQALSAPTLSSLGSKSASAAEQGSVLGVMQSVSSLARAVGPSLAAVLIYSAVAHVGYDGIAQKMSDASILRTFWAAAGIQFAGFLLAIYFAKAYGKKYATGEMVER